MWAECPPWKRKIGKRWGKVEKSSYNWKQVEKRVQNLLKGKNWGKRKRKKKSKVGNILLPCPFWQVLLATPAFKRRLSKRLSSTQGASGKKNDSDLVTLIDKDTCYNPVLFLILSQLHKHGIFFITNTIHFLLAALTRPGCNRCFNNMQSYLSQVSQLNPFKVRECILNCFYLFLSNTILLLCTSL